MGRVLTQCLTESHSCTMTIFLLSLLLLGSAAALECPAYDVNILNPTNTLPYFQDVPSWEACGLLCEENAECNVWTYNDSGNCFLKEKNQGEEALSGVISGEKD